MAPQIALHPPADSDSIPGVRLAACLAIGGRAGTALTKRFVMVVNGMHDACMHMAGAAAAALQSALRGAPPDGAYVHGVACHGVGLGPRACRSILAVVNPIKIACRLAMRACVSA